jgi:hypothetical protein
MGLYHVSNYMGTPAATTTSSKTQVGLTARTASLRRGQIVDIAVGPDGAPNTTDGSVVYTVERCTAAGTAGASPTPKALNPADAAADALAGVMHSIEPTIAASYADAVLTLSLNQRASQRWIAAPGEELIWPATDVNGLAVRAKSATLIAVGVSVIFADL